MASHIQPPLPQFLTPPGSWEALRRPPRHNDEALTGTTRRWLRCLPAGRRPLRLCTQYPRVANRIAWHWRDPAQAREVLDDLLNDRRGGRRGFPRPIVLELRRLLEVCGAAPEGAEPAGYLHALRHLLSRH